MLKLQKVCCQNINFVTPTHFVPQIVKSLKISRELGLRGFFILFEGSSIQEDSMQEESFYAKNDLYLHDSYFTFITLDLYAIITIKKAYEI